MRSTAELSAGVSRFVAARVSRMLESMASTTDTLQHRQPPRGHLLPLDGVRGLAILMVVCSHEFAANYETAHGFAGFLGHVFYYGFFGVDLFFVLSGFLITGILFDSLRDNGYFRKFYARRALRIFPLYYGVLLVCFLLTRPLHLVWNGMGWLLVFYLQNLRPMEIMTFSPGGNIGLFHFWSLAVEEQFYLVWPAVLFLVRNRPNARQIVLWTTLASSVAALVLRVSLMSHGVSPFVMHVTTALRADSLLLGGTLAMLYRSAQWERAQRWAPWGFGVAAALTLASVIFLEPWLLAHSALAAALWNEGYRYSLLAVGFACLIAWSLRPGSACKAVFEWRWLRFLGKYSYGLYVLHVFIPEQLLLQSRATLAEATGSKMLAVGATGVLAIAASLGLAWLSYHVYERPFLRLKHYFDYARPSLNHGAPEDAGSGFKTA